MSKLKYLAGYSATVTDQVHKLIESDKLAEVLLKKYPVAHDNRTDKALYAYTSGDEESISPAIQSTQ